MAHFHITHRADADASLSQSLSPSDYAEILQSQPPAPSRDATSIPRGILPVGTGNPDPDVDTAIHGPSTAEVFGSQSQSSVDSAMSESWSFTPPPPTQLARSSTMVTIPDADETTFRAGSGWGQTRTQSTTSTSTVSTAMSFMSMCARGCGQPPDLEWTMHSQMESLMQMYCTSQSQTQSQTQSQSQSYDDHEENAQSQSNVSNSESNAMVAHNQNQNRDSAGDPTTTARVAHSAESENAALREELATAREELATAQAEIASLREQLGAVLADAADERQVRLALEQTLQDAIEQLSRAY